MLTQEAAILAHLRTGKIITPLEALDKYGCFRLASVIHSLRKDGWKIDTQQGTNCSQGRKKHFALYKLDTSVHAGGVQRSFKF